MSKILLKINDVKELSYEADGYILGIDKYSFLFGKTFNIDEIKKIDDEIIGLIKSENLSYYSENTIFVDEERYEVDSRIISKPFTINNNIMCFLDNGNLFCLNVVWTFMAVCSYINWKKVMKHFTKNL